MLAYREQVVKRDAEAASDRVGRTVQGKWRIDRLIGVGGMAAVAS